MLDHRRAFSGLVTIALGATFLGACGGSGSTTQADLGPQGGASAGGASSKGGSAGKAGASASAGGANTGGTSTAKGGASAGGASAGGASMSQGGTGAASGSSAKGGASAGGASAGGASAGGSSAGGASAGGASGCPAGTLDCDANPLNGCEVKAASDPKNCGACGKTCDTGANGQAACVAGACGLTCNAGFLDCDGNAKNGCETTPDTDPKNCGKCGNACPMGGMCVMGACACAGTSSVAQLIPVDMYIMLDKSGSMAQQDGGSQSKWANVTSALTQFANTAGAGIGVGLQYFPLAPECAATTYSTPAVAIAPLPANAPAIQMSLASHAPGGGTPTKPALQGAIDYSSAWAKANPTHKVIVVLATDGQPNDCSSTVASVSAVAMAGYAATPSIPTYVIGVGSSTGNLDMIAVAGGTSAAIVVNTGDPSAFLAAMKKIQNAQVGCEYLIPAPSGGQMLDYTKVNVVYTPGSGGAPITIPNVNSQPACDPVKGGWYYDAPVKPTKIELCPATCSTVQKDAKAKIEVELGCDTIKP